MPRYSPDGRSVAFSSGRLGTERLFLADADGSLIRQLTPDRGTQASWSPSGRRIAFHGNSPRGIGADVYVMDVDGGFVRNLSNDEHPSGVPSWSADEQWVYFNSSGSGRQEIYKMPAGGGERVQLTRTGGWVPIEGPEERFVYYCKPDPAEGLWRVSIDGGAEERVLARRIGWGDWTLWQHAVIFVDRGRGGRQCGPHR